ncbi:MAG: cytidylyltransferase domain-containing protein [Candidatus Anammoxibacter sp.]
MTPNNPIAIVQARMGSSRLPGKVLKPFVGKPALWHLVDRLRYSKHLKDIVIATTVNKEDDTIVDFCKENKIKWFRGSEKDVLDRYYQAAKLFKADPVIRSTADCPVIDPTIFDEAMEGYGESEYDIYGIDGELPDGIGGGWFRFWVLEDTWKNARLPSEREHVGPYMGKHPEKYKVGCLKKYKGLSHHRWTLDEEADYRFLKEIFDRLYKPGKIFLMQDILDLLEAEPQLMEINAGIIRDEGYLKSLEEDKEYLKKMAKNN